MAHKNKQQMWQDQWIANNLEEIKVRVHKGEKQPIKDHAEKMGESVNAFITRAIKETIERDNNK